MFQKFDTVCLISLLFRLFLAIFALIIILILAFPIGFYGMAMYLEPSLPKVDELKTMPLEMPLQIYTADNLLIGQYGNRYSLPIGYEEMPKQLIQAFLAAEDDTFFEHSGISVKGLGRAITQMLTNNDQQTGGSTITQQVAKNYFLSPEQTFERKLTEMFLARRIENQMTKNEIFTLYVNKIYLGQGAYGIKAGAKRYYNKALEELNLAEMAMLAGLPKAPSDYNPVVNPKRALERRNWILGRMYDEGFITQLERDEAIASDINLNMYGKPTNYDVDMPDLAELARTTLVNAYGEGAMYTGWRVQLTIDSKMQLAAETAIGSLKHYTKRGPYTIEAKKGEPKHFSVLTDAITGKNTYPAKVLEVRDKTLVVVMADGNQLTIDRPLIKHKRWAVQVGNIIRISSPNGSPNDKSAWRVVQPHVQGALASVNPENGAVIALVGGFNVKHNKFNRATQGYRQPGSIMKPFVFASALETGRFSPNDIILDTPINIHGWQPKNAGGGFRGAMTISSALAYSRNIPAVRLLQAAGIDNTIALMDNFGMEKNRLPAVFPLALGAADTTPLQMATAYAAFANGGHRVQPYIIERVYNFNNDLVYQANPLHACAICFNDTLEQTNQKLAESFAKKHPDNAQSDTQEKTKEQTQTPIDEKTTGKKIDTKTAINTKISDRLEPNAPVQYLVAEQAPRIISPETAYNMAVMLRGALAGTGKRAQIGRPDIAGKTGTTNQAKDVWFAGIHPTNSAVVWIGFDNPESLGQNAYGGTLAAPIWAKYMRVALAGKPIQKITAENRSESTTQKQKIVEITDDTPQTLADEDVVEGDGEMAMEDDGEIIPEGDGE